MRGKYTIFPMGTKTVFNNIPVISHAAAFSAGVVQASTALASTVVCGLLYGASIAFGRKSQVSQALYGATNRSFKFMTFGFRNLKGPTGRGNAENQLVLNNGDTDFSEVTPSNPEVRTSPPVEQINPEHEEKSIENFLKSPHSYIDGPFSPFFHLDECGNDYIEGAKDRDHDLSGPGRPSKYMVKFIELAMDRYYINAGDMTPEVIEGCVSENELDAKKKELRKMVKGLDAKKEELHKMVNKHFFEDTKMQSKLKIFIDCCDEFKFHKNGYKEDNKDGGKDGGESFKDIWDRKNKEPEETLPKPVSFDVLHVIGTVVGAENYVNQSQEISSYFQIPVPLTTQGATTPQTYTVSSPLVQDVKSHQIENAPQYTPLENPGNASQLAGLPMPLPMPTPSPQKGSQEYIKVRSISNHSSSDSTQPSPLFQMPVLRR